MNKSPLLILGLLLAGLSLWLLGSDGASVPAGLELGAEPNNREQVSAPERLPQHLDVEHQRESVARPFDKDRWAPEDFTITSDVRGDGSVMLEVRLDISDGLSSGSLGFDRRAGVFPGIRVVMQTWDEVADEIFEHEERTDSEGLARFAFPGAVHVDWVRGDLPPGFPQHVAYTWLHMDISPGDHIRVSLPVARGVHVLGRVISPSGVPLAGVPVSAFPDDRVFRETFSPNEAWLPGTYETVSRHDGSFEFLALPDEGAAIGVPPGEWLQVNTDAPPNVRNDAPEGLKDHLPLGAIRADTHFVRELVVVRRVELHVLVLDAGGQPAADVAVAIEPEFLLDANLIGREDWEARINGVLSSEDAALLRNRHLWDASEELVTDEFGRTSFFGSKGTWRLGFLPAGLDYSSEFEFEFVVSLPQVEEQVVRLPWRLRGLSGRVVNSLDGRGISNAKVDYWTSGAFETVETDRQGGFSFKHMVREGPYRLAVTHLDFFAEGVEFALADESPLVEMRPSAALRLKLVGKPPAIMPTGKIRLLRRIGGSSGSAPGVPRGSQASGHEVRRLGLRSDGTVEFNHLQPGMYDVELWLFELSEAKDSWGRSGQREVCWAHWSLSTATTEHQLSVDLGAFVQAGPRNLSAARTGRVLDGTSHEPISGAVLTVTYGTRKHRFDCDESGEFWIVAPDMDLNCEVTAPGYESVKRVLEVDFRKQKILMNVFGAPTPPLKDLGD